MHTRHDLPRALFLSADVPWPPDGGGRIATLHILEAISKRYRVDLVCMGDTSATDELPELRALCETVHVEPVAFTFARHRIRQSLVLARSLLSREPYRLRKFRSAGFERRIRELLGEHDYDLVHCDQFGVVPYARLAPVSAVTTAAHHNVESDIYQRAVENAHNPIRKLVADIERLKLKRAERSLLGALDHVFVLTSDDAALLRPLGVTRVSVVPMPAPGLRAERRDAPAVRRILSLGSMGWYGVADGLRWFAEKVLPRVRAAVPDAEWDLVGPNAPAAIQRLTRDPAIHVRGYVPSIESYLEQSRVAIVPLQVAGGVRMKLLDLMAAGTPAVSTALGARGLDVGPDSGCEIHDSPEDFGDAVVRLLMDDEYWQQLSDAGRQAASSRFTVDATVSAVAAGLDDGAARRAARLGDGGARSTELVRIGDVTLHNVDQREADEVLKSWLATRDGTPRYVCTPNVDYVIRAGRDSAFRQAIENASLRVPDGMWIVYASRLAGTPLKGTVTGRLLLPRFAGHCAATGRTLALLGAGPGVAQTAADALRTQNPDLVITDAITPPMPFVVGSKEDDEIVARLKANPPDMLFVALGAPRQEVWMDAHSHDLPTTLMVGVGAALDVVSGQVHEAPAWATRIGLEWLIRLVQEPRRLARRYLWDDPRILWWAVKARFGRTESASR